MRFNDLPRGVKDHLREKEITVSPIGIQRGHDRFPALKSRSAFESRRPNEVPVIKGWRLNLTGLSQAYNLFFVAYLDKIYVYEPNFPDQKLPQRPALILDPPRTPAAQNGFIDQHNPHLINHLFIDFLGELEIILVACDNGDVIGYYTQRIQAAIERREENDGPNTILGQDVPPFFAHNVEESAWGLSVHSEARKIAVSANSAQVTVFPFGLLQPDSSNDSSSDGKPLAKIILNDPVDRSSDQKFTLKKMRHNIPSIAFCNTPDDPNGRLLVSGDITGLVYLWNLHSTKVAELFRVRFCKVDDARQCRCSSIESFPHAVWGLAWLDRRSFRKIEDYAPEIMYKYTCWDGSIMRRLVPDSSPSYSYKRPQGTGNNTQNMGVGLGDDEDDTESDETDMELTDLIPSVFEVSPAMRAYALQERAEKEIAELVVSRRHPWCSEEESISNKKFELFQHEGNDLPPTTLRTEDRFPCPLFIASKSDACMFQPSDPKTDTKPIIGLSDPLTQRYVSGWTPPGGAVSDRLSLQVQVPELGVLVVGSPSGRVAVFSLNQTGWYHRTLPVYFQRMDWILPFASQEERGERPEVRLVGLAVSPIQGFIGKRDGEEARPWRLLLYYIDHSVLSYQLSADGELAARHPE